MTRPFCQKSGMCDDRCFDAATLGLESLLSIVAAADNLEAMLWDFVEINILELNGNDESAPQMMVAFDELRHALAPYREARDHALTRASA